jgi:hypothetical protein
MAKIDKNYLNIHMKKIAHFFSKDFRIFLDILMILTWLLSIFTLFTFIAVIFDCAIKNSFTYPSAQGIDTFLSGHKKFYPLYGATVALVIAYIAVKQYLQLNNLQALDFFFEKLVPEANRTINLAKNELSVKMLTTKLEEYVNNNKQINFTREELEKEDPELYNKLLELHLNNLEFQMKAVLTLGYFESFSIKLTKGLVNYTLIETTCQKAFCVQVRNLYPLFSITRRENDKKYFPTVVYLFNKWKHVLTTPSSSSSKLLAS